MATNSQTFDNLLRCNKVLKLSPNRPASLTSHGGYLHRNDWGLKYSMPKSSRKTPYIYLKQIDTRHAFPEFRSSTTDSLFVKKFDEMGLKIGGSSMDREGNANLYLSSSVQPSSQNYSHLANSNLAESNMLSNAIDWTALSESDFKKFLRQLRRSRKKFKEHVEAKKPLFQKTRLTTPATDLYTEVVRNGHVGYHVSEFLNDPKTVERCRRLDPDSHRIIPILHPNQGLNYAPLNQIKDYMQKDPIPGRILAGRLSTSPQAYRPEMNTFKNYNTLLLGVIADLTKANATSVEKLIPVTSFNVERDNIFPLGEGKQFFKIQGIKVEDPYLAKYDTRRDASHKSRALDYITNQWKIFIDPREMRTSSQTGWNFESKLSNLGGELWAHGSGRLRQSIVVNSLSDSAIRMEVAVFRERSEAEIRNEGKDTEIKAERRRASAAAVGGPVTSLMSQLFQMNLKY